MNKKIVRMIEQYTDEIHVIYEELKKGKISINQAKIAMDATLNVIQSLRMNV